MKLKEKANKKLEIFERNYIDKALKSIFVN